MPENPYLQYLQGAGSNQNYIPTQEGPIYADWTTPDDIEVERNNSMLYELVGSGLWAFMDEGLFGVPGMIGGQEFQQDMAPETFLGQMSAGIGGIAGYAAGAPLKLGRKAISMAVKKSGVAEQLIKAGGEKFVLGSAESVARKSVKNAVDAGLKREIAEDVGQSYINLARRGQMGADLAGAFGRKSGKVIDEVVGDYAAKGLIGKKEFDIVKNVLKTDLTKRPINSFKELYLAKGDPSKAKYIGYMADEIVTFLTIDTFREAMHTTINKKVHNMDYSYNWTEPIWGGAIGMGFGALGWLKPIGKSASFKNDLIDGIKGSFRTSVTKGKTLNQVMSRARNLGDQLKRSKVEGEDTIIPVNLNGKQYDLDLINPTKAIAEYGDKVGEEVVRKGLDEQTRKHGRSLVKWAVKEEAESLKKNWFRMTMGGTIFNARSLFDIAVNDQEITVNDMLPTFLIGAFLQRRGTPKDWDLNDRVNDIRKNLRVLGVQTKNLIDIPTFNPYNSLHQNPISHNETLKKARDLAIEKNIITDDYDVSKSDIDEGQRSVLIADQMTGDYEVFRSFYRLLGGQRKHTKELSRISEKDAGEIQKILTDATWEGIDGGKIKDGQDAFRVFDNINESASTIFDRNMKVTLSELKAIPELGIRTDLNIDELHMGEFPEMILASTLDLDDGTPSLKKLAMDGQLIEGLSGNAANKELQGTINKANKIIKAFTDMDALDPIKLDPNDKSKTYTISTLEGYDKLKLVIDRFEENINSGLEARSDFSFDVNKHLDDMVYIMQTNRAKDSAKRVSDLLSPIHQSHQEMIQFARRAGIFQVDDNGLDRLIPHAKEKQFIIQGADDVSGERLFLNNFIDLLGAKNDYSGYEYTKPIEVDVQQIRELQSYLGKQGMMTRGPAMGKWAAFTQNYILQDIIRQSNVSIEDVTAVTSMRSVKDADLVAKSSGMNRGWQLKLIDAPIDATDTDFNLKVSRYNTWAKDLEGRSDTPSGRLFSLGDEKVLVDKSTMNLIDNILDYATVDAQISARRVITDFMSVSTKDHQGFKNTLDNILTANPTYAKHLISMLESNEIIQKDRAEGYIKYKFNEDGLSEEVTLNGKTVTKAALIKYEFQQLGMDFNTIDAQKKAAQDEVNDMIQAVYEAPTDKNSLSQDEFFKRYFSTSGVVEYADAETQAIALNSINDGIKTGGDTYLDDLIKRDMRLPDANNKRIVNFDLNNPEHALSFNEAKDHLTSLLIGKANSQERLLVQYNLGKPVARRVRMQKTKMFDLFDEMELSVILAQGNTDLFTYDNRGKYHKRQFSLFEAETNYLSGDEKSILKAQLDEFDTSLDVAGNIPVREFGTDLDFGSETMGDGITNGGRIFRISESMQPLVVKNTELINIAKTYKSMIDHYKDNLSKIDNGVHYQDMLSRYNRMIDNPTTKTSAHEMALRTIVYERFVAGSGRKTDDFLPYLSQQKDVDNLTKRLNLLHTPNFKRGISEITKQSARNADDVEIINKFENRGTTRISAWDEKDGNNGSSVKQAVRESFNSDAEFEAWWKRELHDRADESGYDSITYISKEYMRYLQLKYGRAASGETELFKPIIQSDGDVVVYGKTVFVYDKFLNDYFSKSESDMLTTTSAMKGFDSGWNDVLSADPLKSSGYREIPNDAIVIKQDRIHHKDVAKLSISSYNYLTSAEAQLMFGELYGNRLTNALNDFRDLYGDPLKRQAFFNDETLDNQSLESMVQSNSGATQALGALKTYSQFGDPSHISEKAVLSQFYKKLIDPIINQSARIGGRRFGGKAVLIQSLDPNLQARGTIYDQGEIKQYGEVFLPDHERNSKVSNFTGARDDFQVRIVNKDDNKLLELKDIYKDEKSYDLMLSKNLGELHDIIKDQWNGSYQVAIITTRYPSTRPNDKMIVGLKDFLHKDYGNSMIASKLDVLNIFEGDYDVDKNDYYWAHSKTMFDHIDRVNTWSFMQGIDVSKFKAKTQGLYLTGGKGFTDRNLNQNFLASMANSTTFRGNIGVVQKIPRALGWLADKTTKVHEGQRVIMESKDVDGKNSGEWVVTMDYDTNDWRHRSVVEGQYIIDAAKEVDGSLFGMKKEARHNLLFTRMNDPNNPSTTSENYSIGFLRKMAQGKSTERPRLFRRFNLKTKKEENLMPEDIALIDLQLQKYNRLLNLGTDVYDAQGRGKKPSYDDILDFTDDFFTHLDNPQWNTFAALKRRYGNSRVFESYFRPEQKVKKKSQWKKQADIEESDVYANPTQNPFEDGLIANMKQEAEFGSHGQMFDRLMWQIRDADPTRQRHYEGLTGDAVKMMEQSMSRFVSDPDYFSEFSSQVMSFIKSTNDGLNTIKFLKKKWGYIDKQPISVRRKNELKDKINDQIKEIELKNSELLKANPAYAKQPSIENLKDSFIEVVPIDGKPEYIKTQSEMATLNEILRHSGTTPKMKRDIETLHQFERRIFGDLNTLGTTLRYDAKTLLNNRMRKWLGNLPDMATANDIIEMSLMKGVKDHGLHFLYNYANQSAANNRVGIFAGTAVAMPYKPSKRFERILRFMAKASADDPDMGRALKALADIRGVYGHYYNKDHRLISTDPVSGKIGDTDITMEQLSFPKFGANLQNAFESYKSYRWSMQTKPVDNFKLQYEESLDFYHRFFKIFGQDEEFGKFIDQMSHVRRSIESTGLYNPMSYLAHISNMEANITKFANKSLQGTRDSDGKYWDISSMGDARKALRGNSLYALYGGDKHFKGLTLKLPSMLDSFDLSSLKEYTKQSRSIVEGSVSQGKTKRVFDEMFNCGLVKK